MNQAGRHVIADFYTLDHHSDAAIMAACEAAIAHSGMNVVSCTMKRFKPHGLTAVWILEESHFTVHTYPEHRYISVDCYTCGTEGDPAGAVQHLLKALGAKDATARLLKRGDAESRACG